ncbi:hypothetical protein NDU88_001263 [Pleurodeles waltl]|uniref:Uncharacterized protein n=1 Tax=Pleurodeles waltl TaxID=8319 RepID=A0AAV7WN30_PLEWA|nr:hypothetical protein NDU88_001263 [Pleurodeles waltl]
MLVAPLLKAIKKVKAAHEELEMEARDVQDLLQAQNGDNALIRIRTLDYKKEFFLFSHSDRRVMSAVLTQKYPLGHISLAYLRRLLDSVMEGHFPCG